MIWHRQPGSNHPRIFRSLFTVFRLPGFDDDLCVVHAGEPMFVWALVTEATVEQFDSGVPIGFAWLDEEQLYTSCMCPRLHRPTAILLPVVGSDSLGVSAGLG